MISFMSDTMRKIDSSCAKLEKENYELRMELERVQTEFSDYKNQMWEEAKTGFGKVMNSSLKYADKIEQCD